MRIIAVILALAPMLALASHDSRWVWGKAHIPLIDRTHGMGDYVRIKADDYNALDAGFTLDYVRGVADEHCDDTHRIDGKIVVCNKGGAVGCDGPATGCTSLTLKVTNDGDRRIMAAKVVIGTASWSEPGPWGAPYGCHELGHALGLQHQYGDPDTCMGQERDTPGPHDAAMLERMYR